MSSTDVHWVWAALGHSVNRKEEKDYGHPSHRGFQECIDAQPVLLPSINSGLASGTFLESYLAGRKLEFPESDIFLLGNTDTIYAIPSIKRQFPDATFILLAAHRVFGLESYNFKSDPFPKSILRQSERYVDAKLVRKFIRDDIDGILSVSDYVGEYMSDFVTNTPIRPVYPYIQPELMKNLSQASLNVGGCHAITVCESRDHKGVDMLVEAWPSVLEEHPDATLGIVGNGHPETYEDTPGVTVHGFVDDLIREYQRADLYIHPARADAFGVTVIEALRAGTPAVVTNTTGSRGVVSSVSPELVADPNIESLSEKVIQYFDAPVAERRHLAKEGKNASGKYSENKKREEFKQTFQRLKKDIGI